MFGITDLPTYLIGTLLIILLPGPNSLYVMSIATRFGIKVGYQGAFGILCGDSILILLTVLGAATLLHQFPWIFFALKIIGALYLSYLGIRLIYAAYLTWKRPSKDQANVSIEQKQEKFHPFRTALLISLINPKAILFFLSFFVQFVDPAYPYPAQSFLMLAVILQLMSIAYLSMLIFTGIKISNYFNTHYKLAAASVAAIGILFGLFGIKLATSTM